MKHFTPSTFLEVPILDSDMPTQQDLTPYTMATYCLRQGMSIWHSPSLRQCPWTFRPRFNLLTSRTFCQKSEASYFCFGYSPNCSFNQFSQCRAPATTWGSLEVRLEPIFQSKTCSLFCKISRNIPRKLNIWKIVSSSRKINWTNFTDSILRWKRKCRRRPRNSNF